jgi:hypothetical protein
MDDVQPKQVKKTLMDYVRSASKVITYPILGNLSDRAKLSLEAVVGSDWFSAEGATVTSMYSNCVMYPLIALDFRHPLLSAGVSFTYGIFEYLARTKFIDHEENLSTVYRVYPGSLVGKIISIPFDYIYYPFLNQNYKNDLKNMRREQITQDAPAL